MSVINTPKKVNIKIPNSAKNNNFELPKIFQKNSQFSPRVDTDVPTRAKRKKNQNKKKEEEKDLILISEAEMKKKYNEICNLYRNPYDLFIKCLECFPNNRNEQIMNLINSYLRQLIALIDFFSSVKNHNILDKVYRFIAMNLKYNYVQKNRFICRFGDKGTHFSILLKGKINFLVPKLIKCYLNKTEYIEYLLKLKVYGEHELLKQLLNINKQYFDLGDDFEIYLRELLSTSYKPNNKNNTFLTNELYRDIQRIIDEDNKKIIENEENEADNKNRNEINPEFKEEITPEIYIERIKIEDLNLNPKDRKKVSIFYYQNTNFYEGGQIYGTVALENKTNKISATAITADNCYIGTLTKEEYQSHLLPVRLKSRELLYSLINSYNILGVAPKKAFDNRFCHMFKCIRFKRGVKILEEKKKLNSVYVFYSGQFSLTVISDIVELYELVAKLINIRGKILNLKESEIKKELSEIYLKKDFYSNYNSSEQKKLYQKKYNLTISIINDKLAVGLMDTVDQETHFGLFNCTGLSNNCDGYDITFDSLELINKEYPCFNNTNKISLTNLEYYIKRVQLHIKEIEIKIKKANDNFKYNIKPKEYKINNDNNVINEPKKDLSIETEETESHYDDYYEIRRNTFNKVKKNINNEISLEQKISNSFKKDYKDLISRNKKKINQKIDSYKNIYKSYNNNKYENIKTTNNNTEKFDKKRNSSFLMKLRKSVKEKLYLLHLAQCKSNKFMKIQKEEMRSLLKAKNKRDDNSNFVDISSIFQRNKRNQNSEHKSSLILDNIINGINKRGKHERILSSYLTNNNIDEINKEFNINDFNNNKEDKNLQTDEETIKRSFGVNRANIDNIEIKKKDSLLITSNDVKNNEIENDLIHSRNLVNLDGQQLPEDKYILENISSNKKYNKQLNMNKFRKFGKLSEINNKYNNKKKILNKLIKRGKSNKALNIGYEMNKDNIHLVDPLLFDKFNEQYINRRFKTLEK